MSLRLATTHKSYEFQHNTGRAAAPSLVEPQMAERHYSPGELAELWNLSRDTITRMFEREPGVLIFDNPEKTSERRRRTIRIPESVAERVYRRLVTRGNETWALTAGERSCYMGVAMRRFTTNEAADKLGVHRVTLQRWIADGKITVPKMQEIGGAVFRLWAEADIERVRKQISRRKGKAEC